ncbi:MAG: YdcF family protein, partial [Chlorobi bacterium]|nr:YdcF family protein [Chlorobiota bacterium]
NNKNQSRNTHENAIFTKKLTKYFDSKTTYLLVTSAFHMRRAKACFKKAGFKFDIYAVNKKAGPRKYEFDYMFLPDKEAFYYWDLLIHEWAGFIVYKIMGYA